MPETTAAWTPRRDAVTGELLLTEPAYVIRIREDRTDWTPTPAQAARGWEPETTPIPRAIDTAQPYPEGRLGGKRWHPEFTRYLGNHTTKAIAEADREVAEWWHGRYARERVLKGFVATYGPERGAKAFVVALAALSDPERIADLADAAGHTPAWVVRQRSLAYRFAFAKESAA